MPTGVENVFLKSVQSPEGCSGCSPLLESYPVTDIAMAIVDAAMESIWPGNSPPKKQTCQSMLNKKPQRRSVVF